MTTYRASLRDRLVHAAANAVLRLGTREYRVLLSAVVALGFAELDRLSREVSS